MFIIVSTLIFTGLDILVLHTIGLLPDVTRIRKLVEGDSRYLGNISTTLQAYNCMLKHILQF